jgi:hypothetical protein
MQTDISVKGGKRNTSLLEDFWGVIGGCIGPSVNETVGTGEDKILGWSSLKPIEVFAATVMICENGTSAAGGGVAFLGDVPSWMEVEGVTGCEVFSGVPSRDELLFKSFSTQMVSNAENINSDFEGFAYQLTFYKHTHRLQNVLRRY